MSDAKRCLNGEACKLLIFSSAYLNAKGCMYVRQAVLYSGRSPLMASSSWHVPACPTPACSLPAHSRVAKSHKALLMSCFLLLFALFFMASARNLETYFLV